MAILVLLFIMVHNSNMEVCVQKLGHDASGDSVCSVCSVNDLYKEIGVPIYDPQVLQVPEISHGAIIMRLAIGCVCNQHSERWSVLSSNSRPYIYWWNL